MLSDILAPALARRGIHYGWVLVAVTFVTMVATSASMGVLGVMILPLKGEFGWDTGMISGALALRLVLFGLMGPFAAALIQRYGLRAVVTVALALIVTGLGASTLMTQAWQLWASWGLLVGFGTGMTALVLGATVANRWFVTHRGIVVGLLTASSATGQLAFLPLAAWISDQAGWRAAILPAIAACAVSCVLMLLFARDFPADVGLTALGDESLDAGKRPAAGGNAFRNALMVLAEASRSRVFWILFGTFFVCGLSTNGLIQTHFISLCADYGMANVEAASVLAMMGAFDFVGTVLSGWLSDRYDNRYLLFWYYGLRGISLLFLPFSVFTFAGMSLFALFYGLDWIATVPPTVKLAGKEFGREKAPVIFGWVFTGHQLGAATAAFGAGLVRDSFSTYLPAFYAAGGMCLVAAAAILLIRSGSAGAARRLPQPAMAGA